MDLFFESRPEIAEDTTGKIQFFQRKPRIHPEPVLEPDSPADGGGVTLYGTVLHDGGRLRMWYQAWPRNWKGGNVDYVGYAESGDGIEWRKPKLGLVDHAGSGSNLVNLRGHPPSLFIDPDAPADHRYRATVCTGPFHEGAQANLKRYGFYTAHSGDGLHWAYDRDEPRWKNADVITCAYSPIRRQALIAMKYLHRFQGFTRRSIWNAEFQDGQWSDQRMALIPDDFDNVRAMSQGGYASADYYGMGLMPAGHGMVGFLWQFRHSNLPRTANGCAWFGEVDVTLAYQNRAGDCWLHVPGRPDFISHAEIPWGGGGVYTACCPVEVGDEQRLYFSACRRSHAWYCNYTDLSLNAESMRTLTDEGIGRIGFAAWPKWRLFGFRSDPQGTVPLYLRLNAPCEFRLNYECEPGGSVRADVSALRADWPGVEGRSLADAVALTGDSFSAPLAWRSGTSIQPGEDGLTKIVLHLDRARIYAFEIVPGSVRSLKEGI
jgi:hypothetical protein